MEVCAGRAEVVRPPSTSPLPPQSPHPRRLARESSVRVKVCKCVRPGPPSPRQRQRTALPACVAHFLSDSCLSCSCLLFVSGSSSFSSRWNHSFTELAPWSCSYRKEETFSQHCKPDWSRVATVQAQVWARDAQVRVRLPEETRQQPFFLQRLIMLRALFVRERFCQAKEAPKECFSPAWPVAATTSFRQNQPCSRFHGLNHKVHSEREILRQSPLQRKRCPVQESCKGHATHVRSSNLGRRPQPADRGRALGAMEAAGLC